MCKLMNYKYVKQSLNRNIKNLDQDHKACNEYGSSGGWK